MEIRNPELLRIAARVVVAIRRVGTSQVQRKVRVGFATAARIACKIGTFTVGALTSLLVLVSSFNMVSTQNIGIVTSFGKPVGHVGNGAVWVAPWDQVTDMDEAVQVSDYEGGNCITIRIAEGQTACFDAKIRWRVNASGSDAVFKNFKNSTQGVQAGLIEPELNRALNNAFEMFNPVNQITTTAAIGSPANPSITQLTQQVQNQMQASAGFDTDVTIISMFLKPNYDGSVQNKLNAISTQAGQTVIAQEQIATNHELALSYDQLAKELAANPNVLVSQCLTNVLEPLAKAGNVPVGVGCWPGGSSTPVIANATGK